MVPISLKLSRCVCSIVLGSLALCTSLNGQSKDDLQNIAASGFVDVYYNRNFADPSTRANKLRNFDIPENQINLSMAEISLQKKAEPVGFRITAGFGSTSDVVHGIAPYGSNSFSALTIFQQAYLTAVLPLGAGLSVDAGKFATHMGNEVIESKENWNYSRSLLFAFAIPYYHTGIRLTYPFSASFSATAHIVNGWNSVVDNNDQTTLGLTMNYAPSGSTGIILNAIDGVEQPSGVAAGKKSVFDLTITQQLTESLSLMLNADYGQERLSTGLPVWKGIAIYGRYLVGARSAVALRGEVFDDPTGYATGFGIPSLDVRELTGTYEYRFTDALLLRTEARYDFANSPVFDEKSSVNVKNGQTTLLLGIVAIF